MFYVIEGAALRPTGEESWSTEHEGLLVGLCAPEEFETLRESLHLGDRPFQEWRRSPSMWFENGEGVDILSLSTRPKGQKGEGHRMLVVLRSNLLFIVCADPDAVLALLAALPEGRVWNAGRLLFLLMERMTAGDHRMLEEMENEIAALENALLLGKRDCVREIISLRKRLMGLKRHYEQLLDVLDDVLENENDLLDPAVLRLFRVHSNRVDRLYHSVLNLRDYVTQVRESYQAEVDISLNNIMKLFTVITAIFLPLTLLVGWYGMNLKMPEYNWPYAYPMVIAASLVIVGVCVLYFKRNKWF